MKTIKKLSVVIMILLGFGCSSDDDNGGGMQEEITMAERLTSGTWYQESKTPGDLTDCEKNTWFKFNTDNSLVAEFFDENNGPCESEGVVNSTYTLNGTILTITFGSDIITANIDSISATMLTVTDSNGDTVVFDKVQG